MRVEEWTVASGGRWSPSNSKVPGEQKVIVKVAVRQKDGKFHPATNFRQEF